METAQQVTIEGDATRTVIITGDGNQVSLSAQGEFAYHPLDEDFRTMQGSRTPADFYNGTRPNWANIAAQHDSPRRMLDDLLKFVTDPKLPAQRVGIITGLSGEGKTTLLMRAAWKLAEAGHPVLWRHYGHVLSSYLLPLTGEQRLVICFDEIAYEEKLPNLISDLAESGLPFIVLGSARQHDWENSELRSAFQRMAYLREFRLDRLQKDEVQDLLQCLDRADALGALASLSPDQRVSHFLDRLEADGQLLPALLTARRGQSFGQILESVFEDLSKRHGQETTEFLLRSYAGIALVHRFNFGMTRPLLAGFVSMKEDRITHRLLHPLQGELLEISTEEEQLLNTRHPWIAEAALGLLCGRYLPEDTYLYQDLYQALGSLLQSNPLLPERKLLSQLPLAFKRRGQIEQSRQLFKLAAEVAPNKARTLQPWALMEKEQGNHERARELFKQAAKADPEHAPVYQAWALMEKEQGNYEQARELFKQGAWANPKDPVTFQAWALMEKEQGNHERARELFQQAAQVDLKHGHTFQAWALMEKEQGNHERARELFQQALLVDPKHAHALHAWALMEKELGNYERARELFQQAAQADPKHAPVYRAWALMEKEQGNHEQARILFEQAAQADPNNAFAYKAWALMEKEQGNYERARELFQQAAQTDPKSVSVYQVWALMEARHGDDSTAQKILERGLKCVSKRQGQALILSTFGVLLARRKDFALARQFFNEALSLDETNPLNHYHFAVECLLPDGDEKAACQHLHRALQLRLRKERDRRRVQQALEQYCDQRRSSG